MKKKHWYVEYMTEPEKVWQRSENFDSKDEAIIWARNENQKYDGGEAVHAVYEVPGFKEIYKRGYMAPRCAKCNDVITSTMGEWVPYTCFKCLR